MKFQYRAAVETATLDEDDETGWTGLATTAEENKYTAMLTGLTAETTYEYRLVNGEGDIIATQSFTTDIADKQDTLYNGNFERWTTGSSDGSKTIYPGSANEAGNTTCFWNTSNPGTSQGLAAFVAKNPTTSATSLVQNEKGGIYAAKLQSTSTVGVFAAASLYIGNFLDLDYAQKAATMEFGKPFTSRPIALHGYYQYTPQIINHVERTPEGVTVTNGETMDECSIFIALAKKSFTFNNKKEEEYIDYEGDDNIIAYGALPSGVATSGDSYTEFTIPLQYKESQFGEIPTHIIIVCSASKYGDYMTGADNSLLYVDNFSLVYDGTPAIWKNK